MRSSSSSVSVSGLLLLLLVVLSASSSSEAAISCSDVVKDLRPCVSYLSSGSGKPPPACCSGAKALASAASTTADRKTACNCIKSSAKSLTIKSQLAQALPSNCGISLPFTISADTDCSKIS
ncbi:non-specific lipid-transfer protein 8-like [Prosopis cineraria]|uniref:non-specific lipid-transfer protein 8-like n=1 Tax=Prosopis cineraria TaxID=364024 RepID=UPI00240F4F8F|nr:non-specific lipid-transfer protein 8-like [Prosopis cineraria]